jgi:hypothetical protein
MMTNTLNRIILIRILVLIYFTLVLSDVIILKSTQIIYDRFSKLRIIGLGFEEDVSNIFLEIGPIGSPSLQKDKDYVIFKYEDSIILKLLENRLWVDLTNRIPPVALILSSVKFHGSDRNLLAEPVIVALVVGVPTIPPIDNPMTISQTSTMEIRIMGSNFIGAKKVDLYFNPPLAKGIFYEDVSTYPLPSDFIILRLRQGYSWRQEPGPLTVIGADTGGGPVKVNGDDGIIIANVIPDVIIVPISITDTSSQQILYVDEPTLVISGSGFNPENTTIKFANNLILDKNYSIISITDDSIYLKLLNRSQWISSDLSYLSTALVVLGIDTGSGFEPVQVPGSKKDGIPIATILGSPMVYGQRIAIYRTHSSEFRIIGKEFSVPSIMHPDRRTSFQFSPPLIEGVHYKVLRADHDNILLSLQDNHAWRPEPGWLYLTAINSKGIDTGWRYFPGEGIRVANVVEDPIIGNTNGIYISMSSINLYQSNNTFTIHGTKFHEGISFEFSPKIKEHEDYEIETISSSFVTFRLLPGKVWSNRKCQLIISQLIIGNKTYDIPNFGVRVALIFLTPIIEEKHTMIHNSYSQVLPILGNGLENVFDTVVVLYPTEMDAFTAVSISNNFIYLQLNPDKTWIPSSFFNSSLSSSETIPIVVRRINTGAGWITFNPPKIIAEVSREKQFEGGMLQIQQQAQSMVAQFDVNLNYGSPICSEIIKAQNQFQGEVMISVNYESINPNHLQFYFPSSPYYLGGCNDCNDTILVHQLSPNSIKKIASWPSSFLPVNISSSSPEDRCHSFSVVLNTELFNVSQICVVSTCNHPDCMLSPQSPVLLFNATSLNWIQEAPERFRGQLRIDGTVLNPSWDEHDWIYDVLKATSCNIPSKITFPTYSPTIQPTKSQAITNNKHIPFMSIEDGIKIQFDIQLNYGDYICTEFFYPVIEKNMVIPELSFYYELYSSSKTDLSTRPGLLEFYFPGNNIWFFATNHRDTCYSYYSTINYPLAAFNQICIKKSCIQFPCNDLSFMERYRGEMTLIGYQTSSIGTHFPEPNKPSKCEQFLLEQQSPPTTWSLISRWIPWILGIFFSFVVIMIMAMCIMKQRHYRRYRFYDEEDDSSRNRIPMLFEMGSMALFQRSRRNPRIPFRNQVFSISSVNNPQNNNKNKDVDQNHLSSSFNSTISALHIPSISASSAGRGGNYQRLTTEENGDDVMGQDQEGIDSPPSDRGLI